MKITHITYTRVAHDEVARTLTLRPHDAGVDAFLLEHVESLRQKGVSNSSPLANFTSPADRDRFRALTCNVDAHFLAAAQSLTARLIDEMDGRTTQGLLVCLRLEHDNAAVSGAALKLQVVSEHAAKLEQVATGELSLAAVSKVLDAPGLLQKGALVGDPRPGSDVIVGDRLAQDAAYFPRALGIQTEQRAVDSAAELVAEVAAHSQQAARSLASILPQIPAGPTRTVLTSAAQRIQAITPAMVDDVTNALTLKTRPVNTVDTAAAVKSVIRASGITISGAAAAMDNVRIEQDGDEGWRVIVPSPTEPRREYRH